MKKLLLYSIFIFLTAFVYAENERVIKLSSDEASFKVNDNSINGFSVFSKISEIKSFDVQTKKGAFAQFEVSGFGKSYIAGEPNLPLLNEMIEIPQGANVQVEIISYTEEIINLNDYGILNKIIPAQPSVFKNANLEDLEFYFNERTYKTDAYVKTSIANVEVLGTMRGVKMGRLTISPFQYNPVQNTLRVLNNLEVRVTFNNVDLNKANAIKDKNYSPFFNTTFSRFINHIDAPNKDLMSKYPIKYLIIADRMFETALQPFIEWKTKKGFYVVESYTDEAAVGTTTTSIKSYIQGLYDAGTVEDPAPTFCLFVGDIAQIPPFDGTTNTHVTDLYYFTLDGSGDDYPEMYYGRFSAETVDQLQPQIDKTLMVEQYTMPDDAYLNDVLMIAGADATYAPTHGNGQIYYGTENYFNVAHGLTSATYFYPESETSDAAIIQDISNGLAFANYTAHCDWNMWYDPQFLISDVAGLQNANEYPFMIGNCCLSNKFDEDACLGETLLRTANKGAVAYIGGSNSTLWDEDFYWGVGYRATVTSTPTYDASKLGAYDRLWHENGESTDDWYTTAGQVLNSGNLAVTQGATSNVLYYWEIYHLMGDPSLMPYIGIPSDLSISYSSSTPVGTPSLTVTTEAHAYVALSYNGVLYDVKLADATGVVSLDISGLTMPCTADIVATKQFRKPYVGTLTIVPNNSAYVVYNSHSINDASGNNNGLADYNESILLNVALKNVGIVDATNVEAILQTADANVTITDNTETYGTITANNTISIADAFAFTIADDVTDQYPVQFSLVVTDANDSTWTTNFNIVVNAPELALSFVNVDDGAGNSNGNLDPAEDVMLNVLGTNNGAASTVSGTCTIATASPYVTINTSSVVVPVIASLGTTPLAFSITIDPSTPIGTSIDFTFDLVAGNYTAQLNKTLKVGLIVEDWESNDFSSYDWTNGTLPWIITSGNAYEGTFAAQSADITDDETTTLDLTLFVLNNDSISFYKKVSSESGYDFMKFFIDNVEQDSWSGSIDWSLEQYAVTSGLHTFKWSYEKDGSVDSGDDNAMIDYILLPVFDDSGNNLPEFTSTPTTMALSDFVYTYNVVVTDEDLADVVTITSTSLPTWLTLTDNGNRTATLTGTPSASDAGMHSITLNANDGTVSIPQTFSIAVDLNIEDWESNSFTAFDWATTGAMPWTIVTDDSYSGTYSAKSGAITGGETSTLTIILQVTAPENLEFYKKVSSEFDYDFLTFNIDGTEEGSWSGDVDWSLESYPTDTGSHTFEWVYSKDGSVDDGSDCAWIDFLVLPAFDDATFIESKNGMPTDVRFNIYPNPVTYYTNLEFSIQEKSDIKIEISNITGSVIHSVVNTEMNSGVHKVHFDTSSLSSGIYFCNLHVNDYVITKKLIITK
ncbi:MAG TPA: Gingipain R [Bacteroidales bacterium]|nr:MAG: hypothetical protein A2W98_09840 [Bacteroidetes bacterium GWF2_33_38]OFY68464.1 MAG: hypothetical protein A2265_11670 [Bacteroidetes bacterium RIFOXYA12_FULL_33_9]HBF88642.1 Gingipain R [Bacteroidales bacterium]